MTSFHIPPVFGHQQDGTTKQTQSSSNAAAARVGTVFTFMQLLQLSLQGRKFILVHSGTNNAGIHFYSLCGVGAFKTLKLQRFFSCF